ncbi:MAG: hypothetical protein AAGU21_06570 [Solidesulfovibrio sp.]|uniref:hypothetical protein n=1 Tax=Solidesulfovibrio sp. TaxID=2910990 RepID=UPI002B20254F|nr:hypothetical protein [Solidesulfovibrio sp.]MEA4856837.1 hypothetical protein [Solidesulfovibrio sp.]
MTNMSFPFGDQATCIHTLLTGQRFEARVNHRGQHYYQGRSRWRGRPVICRIGAGDLAHLPDDVYGEIWSGYYDPAEPDSMLFDETHANIFACLKNALAGAAPAPVQAGRAGGRGMSTVKVVPAAEVTKRISP